MRWKALSLILAALIAAGGLFWLHQQRRDLGNRFKSYLKDTLRDSLGLDVSVEGFNARLGREVVLSGVVASVPVSGSGEPLVVFSADEIRMRYSLLDLLRENFAGYFDIVLKRPVFVTNTPFKPEAGVPQARSFELFSGLIHRIRRNARLVIHEGVIEWLNSKGIRAGVEGTMEYRTFNLVVSVDHLPVGMMDVSTRLRIVGELEEEPTTGAARLSGTAETQGSVINWKPMPEESHLRFDLNPETLAIHEARVLGGIDLKGTVALSHEARVHLVFSALAYPVGQIYDIFSFKDASPLGGTLDGELVLDGAPEQLQMRGNLTIHNEDSVAKGQFKNMQLVFEGVYPDVRISQSRVVMPDGSSMRFSDQTVRVEELLNQKTYERLIARTEQAKVIYGDWTLSRKDRGDTVLLEHGFGDLFKLKYEKTQGDPNQIDSTATEEEQLGMEYSLNDSDSLLMELNDEGQLFGLQKKTVF
ncbi:MAG: hypothetical protein HQL11_01875 [Candidatus Omnitrophica bacterium]|nr:hypothetical protein [Candidatus Omnitrophota bacterium]